ncbi:MAG: GHKL domain-containing protein [Clostridiales bacterium]|nr:GHKL domain-containing protein [Clostridiales bacterium]
MKTKITFWLILTFLILILLLTLMNGSIYAESQGVYITIPQNVLVMGISFFVIGGLIINGILTKMLLQYVEQETELNTQAAYLDSINELFRNLKSQRHDFNNHVQTLYGMICNDMIGQAKNYITEVFQYTLNLNEIVSVDRPEVAALLRAKHGTASANNITFHNNIECKMENLPVKSYELVKLLGNIIDNAFHETMKCPDSKRIVDLYIYNQRNYVNIKLSNPGEISVEKETLFSPGVSGKDEHSGLGLYITKNIVDKYNGKIDIENIDGRVKIILKLPV